MSESTRRTFLKGALATSVVGMSLEARANALFVELNDDNYQSEIVNYQGPALVMFYDDDFQRSPYSKHELEALKIVARELSRQRLERFNENPIKFGLFDVTQYNRIEQTKSLSPTEKMNRLRDKYGISEAEFPVTFIYINGKVIDTKVGGPLKESGIQQEARNFLRFWIPSNITDPNESFVWQYRMTSNLRKYQKG